MNRKVLIKIVKRIFIIFPLMLVSAPFGLAWVAVFNTKVPWFDPLMDWAIDGPITAYEKLHGTGSFFKAAPLGAKLNGIAAR